MTKPYEHDIRTLFSDSAEETREWIWGQLDAQAELLYGSRVIIREVRYMGNTVEADAYKSSHCSCGSDSYKGRVELTVDDLVDILNDDESLRDKVKKKQEAERIACEAKQEYLRLKREFGQ